MDSDTHVALALKLLSITGHEDYRAAAAALFPQIDRQPAYFHRLFAHCFDQVPNLVAAAESCGFWCSSVAARDSHDAHSAETALEYIENRLVAEAPRLDAYLQRHAGIRLVAEQAPDASAVALCVVSHIYNDTFNNPVQAFAPMTSLPSGVWALWDELGSIEFRRVLYAPEQIGQLRAEFFADESWQVRFSTDALCAALIARVAAVGALPIEREVWVTSCERLGVADAVDSPEWVEAVEFLAHQDHRLADLFLKFGR